VEITVFQEPGDERHVGVAVRDFGQGIDPIHLPRLTERFYRAHTEKAGSTRGTGLGLAIVKHIVTRHGGRLTIESVPGEGSTFTVRLDRAKSEAKAKVAPKQ
jgi:two-component system phosphate regulon sensor histidine kinase PhoR